MCGCAQFRCQCPSNYYLIWSLSPSKLSWIVSAAITFLSEINFPGEMDTLDLNKKLHFTHKKLFYEHYSEYTTKAFACEESRVIRPKSISTWSYRVIFRDYRLKFLSKRPQNFKKCNKPIIFRELLLRSFGILMFQNCQVCGNLPFGAFPI